MSRETFTSEATGQRRVTVDNSYEERWLHLRNHENGTGVGVALTPDDAKRIARVLDPPALVSEEQYDLLVSAIEQAGGSVEDGLVTLPHRDRYIKVHDHRASEVLVVDTRTSRIVAKSFTFADGNKTVDALNDQEEAA